LFFNAFLFVALALAQVAVPPLKARVTDLTGTLNAQQAAALEQTLAEFESRKGSQIAVLFVPTTKPDSAVEYGVRVFDAWKLGRKGVDDGVLLLVAKEDRRVQIITGRGVEGVLPDAIVKRIVEEDITPRFKQGDFYGGVRAGADRMMRLIEGERFPAPRASPAPVRVPHWLDGQMMFIAAIIVFILGGILRAIFGRVIGAGVVGTVVAILAWLILSSLFIGLVAGVIAFVITLLNSGRSSGWSSGGGGWSSGGGGGFSSSGGGGGGFSGGGGGTAGGGAGGSW
jgi:uncharacterized protein